MLNILSNFKPPNYQTAVIALRNRLRDSLDIQQENIESIFNILEGQQSSVNMQTLCPLINKAVDIHDDTGELVIALTDLDDGDIDTYRKAFNEVSIDDEVGGVSVSTVIENCTKQYKVNGVIGELNDLYMTNVNVDIATINTVIDKYQPQVNEDVMQVKSTLATLSYNGKVSKETFIGFIKSVCSMGSQTADSQTYASLDTSNPFTIITFFTIASQIVTTIIPTLFALLATAFRGILSAIGIIFSGIFYALSQVNSALTDYKINVDQVLPNCAGPICAINGDKNVTYVPQFTRNVFVHLYGSSDEEKQLVKCIQRPGHTIFIWGENDSTSTGDLINAYFTLNLEPYRFFAFLKNHMLSGSVGFDDRETIFSDPDLESCYLTNDELTFAQSDQDYLAKCYFAAIIATVMHLSHGDSVNVLNTGSNFPSSFLGNGYGWTCLFAWCVAFLNGYMNTANPDWIDQMFSLGNITQNIINIHSGIINYIWNETSDWQLYEWRTDTVTDTGFILSCTSYRNPFSYLFSSHSSTPSIVYMNLLSEHDLLDAPLASPMFTAPQISATLFTGISVLLLATVSAALLSVKLIQRKLTIRSTIKKAKYASNYKESYDAMLASPTKDNVNAYRKARLGYNLRAKVFGWDSYDPANNWYEAPEDSGLLQTSNTDIIIRLIRGD